MNYLDLVNFVIRESGIQDEELTSGTFATATVLAPIYGKIKYWVNQAWKDIQEEKQEYKWQTGKGVALLRPRLRFYDAINLGGGSFSGNCQTAESKISFATSPPIYFSGSTTEGYVDIIGQPENINTLDSSNTFHGELRVGENIYYPNLQTPSATFRFQSWGEYNFTDQNEPLDTPVTDVGHIHRVPITLLPDDAAQGAQGLVVPYKPFDEWEVAIPAVYPQPASPLYWTETTQGKLIFTSPLDRPYRVSFSYTKKPQQLSSYNDIPQGLDVEKHEYIGWKAVEKYAEYQQRAGVAARASKEIAKFRNRLDKTDVPIISVNPKIRW